MSSLSSAASDEEGVEIPHKEQSTKKKKKKKRKAANEKDGEYGQMSKDPKMDQDKTSKEGVLQSGSKPMVEGESDTLIQDESNKASEPNSVRSAPKKMKNLPWRLNQIGHRTHSGTDCMIFIYDIIKMHLVESRRF